MLAPVPINGFFLLSRAEHARMWRRVLHLRPHFSGTTVAAFERSGLPVTHRHPYRSLGCIAHQRFFSRLPVYLAAIRACIQPVATSSVCFAFSLDLLLLVFVLKHLTGSPARLVYEVADIHPALSAPGWRGQLLRWLERHLVRHCCAVVLTSPAFRSGYFAQVQHFTTFPSVVIEHKVALPPEVRNRICYQAPRGGVLTIGYVGLMKSPASFDLLVRLAEAGAGRIAVHFHGRFVAPLVQAQCERIIAGSPALRYCGPYRSPEDLERVYRDLDLVWDAYQEGDNSRWQRTTRFSEACFFKRPIIYHAGTQDGALAARYDLGLPVTFSDPEASIQRLLAVGEQDLRHWFARLEALPPAFVYYDGEYDHLMRLIVSSFPRPCTS